jgi:hypothetical protein
MLRCDAKTRIKMCFIILHIKGSKVVTYYILHSYLFVYDLQDVLIMPRKSRKPTKSRKSTKNRNPPAAYRGERTDAQKYQGVFRLAASASGGYLEPINLSICDQLTTIQATWALWRLDAFKVICTPAAPESGAYAICPFEAVTGATPVTPTTLAAVLDGGGKLKALTNAAENRSVCRYKRKTVNEALFTSTTNIVSNGGDPGFSFFIELIGPSLVGAIFYIEVDAWFTFREPTQFSTFRGMKEVSIGTTPKRDSNFEELSDKELADMMRRQLAIK